MVQSFYNTPGKHTGLLAWVLSTDHKRIGLLYLSCMAAFFLTGMSIGLLMRFELIAPGRTLMAAGTYNESQVLIAKAVRVLGAGEAVTTIDGGNAALPAPGLVRITVGTGNVQFDGFTLRQAGAAGAGSAWRTRRRHWSARQSRASARRR